MKTEYSKIKIIQHRDAVKSLKEKGLNSLEVATKLKLDLLLVNECFAYISQQEASGDRPGQQIQMFKKPE